MHRPELTPAAELRESSCPLVRAIMRGEADHALEAILRAFDKMDRRRGCGWSEFEDSVRFPEAS